MICLASYGYKTGLAYKTDIFACRSHFITLTRNLK